MNGAPPGQLLFDCTMERSPDGRSSPEALTTIELRRLTFTMRPQQLASIEDSRDHRLALLDWNALLFSSSDNLLRKLSSRDSSTSELYQIVGLFFVFQGVIITAVTQANSIKCHNSWPILTLSAIVSVATLFACIQKAREIERAERSYLSEEAVCASLYSSIEKLKQEGSAFDLVEGQPNLHRTYAMSSDLPGFWKTWVWSYEGAVFLVLLVFSGVTLAAARTMICAPQRTP